MFLIILGILDIIGGILLGVSGMPGSAGNAVFFWFGIIFLLKGAYSILAAAGSGFYFDLLGIMDLIAGIFMFLVAWGVVLDFFLYMAAQG